MYIFEFCMAVGFGMRLISMICMQLFLFMFPFTYRYIVRNYENNVVMDYVPIRSQDIGKNHNNVDRPAFIRRALESPELQTRKPQDT